MWYSIIMSYLFIINYLNIRRVYSNPTFIYRNSLFLNLLSIMCGIDAAVDRRKNRKNPLTLFHDYFDVDPPFLPCLFFHIRDRVDRQSVLKKNKKDDSIL